MAKSSVDLYNEYVASLSVGAVKYSSIITGRPIIYCSLKRTSPITKETGEVVYENTTDIAQGEGESMKDFLKRRTQPRDRRSSIKELYPEQANFEPERGIIDYMDGLDGTQRVEYSEDYDYYKMHCTVLRQNQGNSYFAMDPGLQIVLPKVVEVEYKRNDKIIFVYGDTEYIYSVIEQPESYINDVFQLNLKAMYNRPLT